MITNSRVSQYSPNSEESDEQPLDFSKNSISASALTSINIKRESNGRDRHSTPSPEARQSPHQPPANCFTTPSPSPPEHNPNSHHTNQVLCQLLTGNLIPTSTGKLITAKTGGKNAVNPLSVQNDSPGIRFNRLTSPSPTALSGSSPPNASVIHALNERHNSSISPTGSASPIGMGPLNQVEMHFAHSPNASGVDRFGTSGGLLTTAPAAAFVANDSAKRALKYSRPFKAYPRDPLSIPMSYYGVGLQMPLTADAIATQSLLATASDQAYLQFREQMLVSRKNTQEPRRNGQLPGQQSSPPLPEIVNTNSNSNGNNNISNNTHNNSNNGNNQQNVYSNRSLSPSSHSLAAKLNGSKAAMTPISSASHINSDETLDYSNGNSSGNSSSGEADVGSMNSSSGANSGRHSDGHQSMRKRGRPLPEDLKDEAYWERRRKNNEAAKRSRDARRAKEDEIAIRAAFLEQENLKLRCEIAQLKTETTKLRCLLYNS